MSKNLSRHLHNFLKIHIHFSVGNFFKILKIATVRTECYQGEEQTNDWSDAKILLTVENSSNISRRFVNDVSMELSLCCPWSLARTIN